MADDRKDPDPAAKPAEGGAPARHSLSVKKRLFLFAGFYLLAIALVGWVAFSAVRTIRADLLRLDQARAEQQVYESLKNLGTEFLMVTERWVHTGDPDERRLYRSKEKAFAEALEKARTLADRPEEKAIVERLEKSVAAVQEVSRTLFALPPSELRSERTLDMLTVYEAHGKDFLRSCRALDAVAALQVDRAVVRSGHLQKRIHAMLALIVTAVLLLTVLVVVRLARWISVPVDRLIEGAERVARGDFGYRIGLERDDEFGRLGGAFDRMAAALEQSRARLDARLVESETLMAVARVANSTIELDRILENITAIVAEKLAVDVCSIYLVTDDDSVELHATRGLDPDSVGKVRLPLGEGVVGRVALQRAPLAVRDLGESPDFVEVPGSDAADFRSMLAVPILHEDACEGVLTVQTRRPHVYTRDQRNLLTLISHNIAGAIRNAELYDRTRRQLERLRGIYDLGIAINSVLDLDRLLDEICRRTAHMLQAEGAIVRLLEGDHLVIRAAYGLPDTLDTRQPLPLGEGIAGRVARDGRPLLVADAKEMPEGYRVPGIRTRSVLAVPLKLGTRVIGTIGHYNKTVGGRESAFSTADLDTLTAIAAMAAIAIENARLYREEQEREAEVREAVTRLHTLFETVQGGIVTVDREGRIRSANQYIARWIGRDVDTMVGRRCEEVFSEGFDMCSQNPVQVTFETGTSTKISRKVSLRDEERYLEITTYPLRDDQGEVIEVIVFFLDITDRMRAEEEILSLYSEVNQTKKYLESLITNSADAIITTDLDGIVASWNKGAENIYGYRAEEVLNRPIPIMPDFLLPAEKENTERVLRRETIRDIETLRRTKSGALIEVSLTLSPILDEQGRVIGISGISRDITDKRRVEQELTRRNQELSRLLFISNAMRSTLDIDRLLRMTLTAVTMSDGLGFNRALLFEVDEDQRMIRGVMGVGPASLEEAWRIWGELAMERKSLEDIMRDIAESPVRKESFLDRLAMNIQVPVENGESILARVVKEKRPVNIRDARNDPGVDPILVQQLGTEAFALIPLVSQDKVVGILWMDNLFNRRPITDEDIRFLTGFGNHVASAIHNARLFEKVSMAEAELKNIFESISDMVYFNDSDFTIRKVNRAVLEKIGLPEEEIIGRKCYEIFHGTDEPWPRCPHTKTVRTGQAYIEEIEDPHLGGTYMVSSSPIQDRSGRMIGTVHISRDVSESRKLREQLQKAEKMAALGEMAAKIAHEIRNPLISVGGFARRLEKKLQGPEKDYATIIVDSVNHLEAILKDILGFVRETPIIRVRGDLAEILDQLVSLFAPSLRERGIRIEKEYRQISLEVPIDSNKIREALTNLIRNAEQALEGGGVIRIVLDRTEKEAVVEVTDNGPGISEEDCRHIFDPFFTTKMSGTGLGLAITQRIVELHRGRLTVSSGAKTGTTFRMYLPLEEG